MTYCSSIEDLSHLKNWQFDVAIIDYDLGSVTGFELTNYLENYTKNMPVILVSQTQQLNSKNWPFTIREFVHKSLGPETILKAAFNVCDPKKVQKQTRESKSNLA